MAIAYQKNRTYSLIVGNINTGDGFEIKDSLNISFDVTKTSSAKDKSNSAFVEITNLSKEKQKWLEQDYIGVVLSVGHVDTGGAKRLFFGEAVYVTTRKSGTETVTQIQFSPNYTELNHQTISKVVPAGKTVKDVILEVTKAMPGITRTVFNGGNINTPIVDGYPIVGSPRETLDELSKAYEIDWNADDTVLYVHDASGASTDDLKTAIVIGPYTGQVDRPYATSGDPKRKKNDVVKKKGVQVKVILNPEIRAGSIVKLVDENFEGYYKVSSLRSYGEFRGNDWYTDLRLDYLV